jgi:hypothetical protein
MTRDHGHSRDDDRREPADPVGKAQSVRASRDKAAGACRRCDAHGWVWTARNTGYWCDHR